MPATSERFAALFDLDGTLVDTAEDLAASMNSALAAAGHREVPAVAVRSLVGFGARRMLSQGYLASTGRAASEAELDAGLDHFLNHYEANIAIFSRPFDGALELLDALKVAGWGIAICTNKRERLARTLLKALKIHDIFDVIVGADTTSAAKPDPAPVRHCMQAMNVRQGVFFGDSDTDIRAAGAANMPCYIAEFGYGPITLKNQAQALFSDYADALALMKSDFNI